MFSECLSHRDIALKFPVESVKSAGFVQIVPDPDNVGRVVATPYGESNSLSLKSNSDVDTRLLKLVIS